jgi:hypothetical protein
MGSKNNVNSYVTLPCSKCGRLVENCGESAVKSTCSVCVMGMVGMPSEPVQRVSTGRPAGWHFMNEFVDKDGNVFHKGKEQKKLKGTLPPTKVKPVVRKKTKRRSKEEILLAREKEKRVALKKAVQKQKDFLNHQFGED